jgi:1,4-alpha-glucan branching enzyme
VLSFLRRGSQTEDVTVIVCNFTPLPRHNYRVGVPAGGRWNEVLNSDAPLYGGSGQGNFGGENAAPVGCHGRPYLLNITIPPLGLVAFKPATS